MLIQPLSLSQEIIGYNTEINIILFTLGIFSVFLIAFALYHLRYIRLYKDNLLLSRENSARKDLLDNTLSVMSEGVVSLDTDFRIIDINIAGIQMSGISENPIGLNFEDVFSTTHPEGDGSIINLLSKSLQAKERVKIANNTRITYKDSESRVIAGNISPVIDSSQNVTQLVLVFRDVTESHKQKRFLSIAVESGKSYTWFFNTYNNMFVFGENSQKIYGLDTPNQTSIDFFLAKIHPEDREKILQSHENIVKNRITNFSVEYRISFNNDNKYEWWERRGLTYKDNMDDDEIKYVYGMDINIDEHKERENELLEAKLKAEESDRLKSAFLANMSHEIRTPLNGILGFANLMTDPEYSKEEKQEFVKVINDSSKSLMNLISDILDLSKIESNTMDFDIQTTDLSQQIQEVVYNCRLSVNENVKLIVDPPEKNAQVIIDPQRNEQVLTSLVNNSLKFTERGEIHIGYTTKADYVEVYVSDTGKGIKKEHQNKIFQRFYKIDEFIKGTGLGLSISKAIIERFGGKIWAESEFGKGTVMKYTIPVNSNKEPQSVSTPHKNQQILIAEDLDSNYKFLEVVLSKNYELLWAKNGAEAVEMFKEFKPALVLMDIKMPVMDGLEASINIRMISAHVPIIAQTATVFETDHQAAYDAGCDEVLTKPIKSSLLLLVVDKYINNK